MKRLSGKLALITGASSGIGRSCARRFAEEGADLVLWARRTDRLEALADEIRAASRVSVLVAGVDVRDRAAVGRQAQALIADGRVPDILVNNAGLAAGLARLHEGEFDDWDRMIDTNVRGLLNVSRAFLPAMVARGTGHVINIGSTAGHQVYPKGNVYNATKFAVKALTEGMNLDVAGTAVKVSSVDPGHVETEFATVRFGGDGERAREVYRGFRPLSPDDVADVVTYVAALPPHVNILDVVVLPTAQRNVYVIDREEGTGKREEGKGGQR
ncbi:MAG TPA: SDR family NAD(P)-dependent oxidoreductase [Gemmatimonadales bacterium]|nr:SDR family NAD(P)-dependent oxidoreductase [Gemmatimonadales bacterium]